MDTNYYIDYYTWLSDLDGSYKDITIDIEEE